MSELAKRLRDERKAKATRLATGDPHQKVDASSWTEAEPMNSDVQTGERPVSKQRPMRRGGGKVHGEHEHMRADRTPRKSGGRALVDDFVNRNVREANEDREGTKHDGGFAHGGSPRHPGRERAHRLAGGPLSPPISQGMDGQGRMDFNYPPASRGILKRGGEAKAGHVEKHDAACRCHKCTGGMATGGHVEVHHSSCMCPKCAGGSVSDGSLEGMRPEGGRLARASGGKNWIASATKNKGALHRELHVPEGEKIPAKKLAKAEHSKNPTERKRADLAKTLKGMNHKDGGEVRAHHAKGGKAGKGKMSVNIVIAAPGGDRGAPQAAPMGAAPPPPRPPMPIPVGQPPMAMPGMMPGMMPGAPGMMPPPGAMPGAQGLGAVRPPMPGMMGRKKGGRVDDDPEMDYGAGGAEGRLEKIRKYGKNAHQLEAR